MDDSKDKLEEKAKKLSWTEKRISGTTRIDVAIIAEEVLGGWDISEKILGLGEDMRWYQPSLTDYRRLSDYADLLVSMED